MYSLILDPEKVQMTIFKHIFTTLFMLMYITISKPFAEKQRNTQEFCNEVTIILSIYCMTGYTDFFNSDEGRFANDRVCTIVDQVVNGLIVTVRNE